MMQRNTVKRIFIFFLVFLPIQYAAVGVLSLQKSEPWPAFIFPAFKSVYDSNDYITVNQAHFFLNDTKGGKRTKISPVRLFKGIQHSQLPGFLKKHFADSAEVKGFSSETRKWLKKQIRRKYPSLNADTLYIEWSKKVFVHPGTSIMRDSVKIEKQFNLSLSGV